MGHINLQYESIQVLHGVDVRYYEKDYDIYQPATDAQGVVYASTYVKLIGFDLVKGSVSYNFQTGGYNAQTCSQNTNGVTNSHTFLKKGLKLTQGS